MTGATRRKKKKVPAALKDSGAKGFATRNTKLNVQTRKVLRAHYSAKYRAG